MNESNAPIPSSEVVAVIPARFGSTRFPGKPLAPLMGRPVLEHVVAAARAARRVGAVVVATDHPEILAAAQQAGAEAVLTSPDHPTGSDRIGEAVAGRSESVILNIQGDEPLVPSTAIDSLVELLEGLPEAAVSTLASPLGLGSAEHRDPNVVKVVLDRAGRALYFSRAPIPGRHPSASESAGAALRHVGLYGFRRPAFERFLAREATPLELAEGLEQLRFVESGEIIVVGEVEELPPGVDTPDDLARCEAILKSRGPLWSAEDA